MSEERKVIISLKEYEELVEVETFKIKELKKDIEQLVKKSESVSVINIFSSSMYYPNKKVTCYTREGDVSEQCEFIKELVDERNKLIERCDCINQERDFAQGPLDGLKKTIWYKIARFFSRK